MKSKSSDSFRLVFVNCFFNNLLGALTFCGFHEALQTNEIVYQFSVFERKGHIIIL